MAHCLKHKGNYSDEFWMHSFKVVSCTKTYAHSWSSCPCAHPGETARRRDPTAFNYQPVLCPNVKSKSGCPAGDSCGYAHNVFEQWLHPQRYKALMCTYGSQCTRPSCFFAHSLEELRVPWKGSSTAATSISGTSTTAATTTPSTTVPGEAQQQQQQQAQQHQQQYRAFQLAPQQGPQQLLLAGVTPGANGVTPGPGSDASSDAVWLLRDTGPSALPGVHAAASAAAAVAAASGVSTTQGGSIAAHSHGVFLLGAAGTGLQQSQQPQLNHHQQMPQQGQGQQLGPGGLLGGTIAPTVSGDAATQQQFNEALRRAAAAAASNGHSASAPPRYRVSHSSGIPMCNTTAANTVLLHGVGGRNLSSFNVPGGSTSLAYDTDPAAPLPLDSPSLPLISPLQTQQLHQLNQLRNQQQHPQQQHYQSVSAPLYTVPVPAYSGALFTGLADEPSPALGPAAGGAGGIGGSAGGSGSGGGASSTLSGSLVLEAGGPSGAPAGAPSFECGNAASEATSAAFLYTSTPASGPNSQNQLSASSLASLGIFVGAGAGGGVGSEAAGAGHHAAMAGGPSGPAGAVLGLAQVPGCGSRPLPACAPQLQQHLQQLHQHQHQQQRQVQAQMRQQKQAQSLQQLQQPPLQAPSQRSTGAVQPQATGPSVYSQGARQPQMLQPQQGPGKGPQQQVQPSKASPFHASKSDAALQLLAGPSGGGISWPSQRSAHLQGPPQGLSGLQQGEPNSSLGCSAHSGSTVTTDLCAQPPTSTHAALPSSSWLLTEVGDEAERTSGRLGNWMMRCEGAALYGGYSHQTHEQQQQELLLLQQQQQANKSPPEQGCSLHHARNEIVTATAGNAPPAGACVAEAKGGGPAAPDQLRFQVRSLQLSSGGGPTPQTLGPGETPLRAAMGQTRQHSSSGTSGQEAPAEGSGLHGFHGDEIIHLTFPSQQPHRSCPTPPPGSQPPAAPRPLSSTTSSASDLTASAATTAAAIGPVGGASAVTAAAAAAATLINTRLGSVGASAPSTASGLTAPPSLAAAAAVIDPDVESLLLSSLRLQLHHAGVASHPAAASFPARDWLRQALQGQAQTATRAFLLDLLASYMLPDQLAVVRRLVECLDEAGQLLSCFAGQGQRQGEAAVIGRQVGGGMGIGGGGVIGVGPGAGLLGGNADALGGMGIGSEAAAGEAGEVSAGAGSVGPPGAA